VAERLPKFLAQTVAPHLERSIQSIAVDANVVVDATSPDKIRVEYPAVIAANEYVKTSVLIEFGARGTGAPGARMPVECDLKAAQLEISFPTARPLVMSIERTFWEKATLSHVYCARNRDRGERNVRHWHDIVAIGGTEYGRKAIEHRRERTGARIRRTDIH